MDVYCPYCDAEQEINHDDGFGYEEGLKHEMQCDKCGKNFVFTTSISFNYDAEKADCLNGANHNYELTHTFPNEFSKMRCEFCGDERELTAAERITFKIGTKQSYYDKLNK